MGEDGELTRDDSGNANPVGIPATATEPIEPGTEQLTPAQRGARTRSRQNAERKAAAAAADPTGTGATASAESQKPQGRGQQTFRIQAQAVPTVKDGKAREKPLPVPMAKDAALAAAIGTVDMVSWVGQMAAMDPAAAMTADEKKAIAAPLSRIYEKNAGVAVAVSAWADPLALMSAAGAWLFRVYMVRQGGGIPAGIPTEFASQQQQQAAPAEWPTAPTQAAPTQAAPVPDGGRDNSSVLAAISRMERS